MAVIYLTLEEVENGGNFSVQEQSAPKRKFSLLVLRAVAYHGSCATRTEQETEEARQHNG